MYRGANEVVFVDVAVVPMDRERVLRDQTVVVRNGWITALGPTGRVPLPPGALRIAGRDKYIIPGLSDCHAHLSVGAYTDLDEDTLLFHRPYDTTMAKQRLFLYLANGATTLRNMDYIVASTRMLDGSRLLRLRAETTAGQLWSPRLYTSGPWAPDFTLANPRMRAGLWWHPEMVKPESVATYLAAYQAAGYDFVKVHGEHGVVFDSLVAAVHRLGLRVAGHLTIEQALALGPGTSIEHLWWATKEYGGSGAPRDRADLTAKATALARARIWNCVDLRGDPRDNGTPSTAEVVRALQQAGAGLLVGTDVPASDAWRHDKLDPWVIPGDFNMMRLSDEGVVHEELAHLVQAGLRPYEALAAATKNMAAYLGTADSSGTVEMGKRADLVLLSGNPLEDIRQTAEPAGVMIGGRWMARAEIDRRVAAIRQCYAMAP